MATVGSLTTRSLALGLASTLLGCGLRLGDGQEQEGAAQPVEEALAAGRSPEASSAVAASVPASTVELPRLAKVEHDAAFAFSIRGDGERVLFTNGPRIAALRADSDRRVSAIIKASEAESSVSEIAGEADPRRASNHLIVDLFDRILDATDLEKQWAAWLDRPPLLVASLALDVATPMGAAIDILYTAGRAEMRSYVAEVETPAGVRHVAFAPLSQDCAEVAGEGKCLSPTIFVGSDGVFVGLIAGPSPFVCDGGSRRRAARVLLSAADGSCPSARSEEAVEGVQPLLQGLRDQAELCETAYFGAEPGVRWGDLIPHFGAVLPGASIRVGRGSEFRHLICNEIASWRI